MTQHAHTACPAHVWLGCHSSAVLWDTTGLLCGSSFKNGVAAGTPLLPAAHPLCGLALIIPMPFSSPV